MGLWVYNQQSERINQAIVDVYNASSSEEEPGASFGDDFLFFFFFEREKTAFSYGTRLIVIYREPGQVCGI